ncbi:hypothetical protein [Phormidium sp. CCY1219]|uniref:hypothetical protein n=1 Tax=Phormidium sp. CCY1219 TaxID=2886104 RepID=UPI002D76D7D0|nr:hypothetical protein [Phormidium sp. CCY1219]
MPRAIAISPFISILRPTPCEDRRSPKTPTSSILLGAGCTSTILSPKRSRSFGGEAQTNPLCLFNLSIPLFSPTV